MTPAPKKYRVSALAAFIIEREWVRIRRSEGKPRPWTKDPILAQYRFCNVRREDDRVTRWIAEHWRTPHAKDPHLWFAMVVARLINHPPTLALLSLPGRWNKKQFIRVLETRRASGEKTFGSAYIVSTNGRATDKNVYLAESVLDPLWADRAVIMPKKGDSLWQFFSRLRAYNGMGNFIAGQVVADIKYVKPLWNTLDWDTFAVSGPGSRRGLNRVLGRDVNEPWTDTTWGERFAEVRTAVSALLRPTLDLHAQDLQNCLCEFDKYERARLGEGRPRQNFHPTEE